MIKKSILSLLIFAFSGNQAIASTLLQGYVYVNKPVANASVIIRDVNNKTLTTTTDEQGFYQQDISQLSAPLVLFSDNNLLHRGGQKGRCAGNCITSLVNVLQKDKVNTANINPFTDYFVSEVANQMSFIGPEQLIESGVFSTISDDILIKARQKFYIRFNHALQQVGITDQLFDPVSGSDPNINRLFDLIIFNRGYDSSSGQVGATVLLDMRFKPISEQSIFDYGLVVEQKNENINAQKRIFILSDSTASHYDAKVYPRMGWGQVFDQFIDKSANIVVINGAQSGRSSRSFYDEGWFDLMAPLMKKGDYMIIAFGHNDEKCDSSNTKRGQADVSHLCTYPNDANNRKQFPADNENMSFQTSLERYINFAKQKQMTPILMTPVTRFRDANNKIAFQNQSIDPVSHTHYTSNKLGFAYWGDYSQTIKYTAKVNKVALIDVESLSIEFANQHKNDWQSYWLVVDPNDPKFPYYKTQSSGVIDHPDTTHFQEKGALAIAKIIANAINHYFTLKKGVVIDQSQVNQ
ncbi:MULTISPECIES: SGNH/GDSL hydrolase family protein [unclassified Gilliamella]|uniref:SGNH/GDSL hydrolase family protein n=1 Tax=unclassified Gilliamella TaxID=2685620 RepID=UPI00132A5D88|nr:MULTISPECIES: SGNH/GDSL hydrolase family protein [unclassified Gilliamella]MWN32619.1 hypothetical protein [Gilliamella sp. Pra-s60]MWP30070.1 hypothetical protein [Gilliamella sp. Pra-s54]